MRTNKHGIHILSLVFELIVIVFFSPSVLLNAMIERRVAETNVVAVDAVIIYMIS